MGSHDPITLIALLNEKLVCFFQPAHNVQPAAKWTTANARSPDECCWPPRTCSLWKYRTVTTCMCVASKQVDCQREIHASWCMHGKNGNPWIHGNDGNPYGIAATKIPMRSKANWISQLFFWIPVLDTKRQQAYLHKRLKHYVILKSRNNFQH